jgi:hypothetical protein
MFEFAKKFGVNEKLTFRLFPDPAQESYTLLVKKLKDNLVAAVISNNDKNSVQLNINDEIYIFSEADGGKWVTRTLLMQMHAYPLVILSIAEEPLPLTNLEQKPHAPVGDTEFTGEAQALAPNNGQNQAVAGQGGANSEEDDDLASVPGVTIKELAAEPERAPGQEGIRFGADDLDSLPDIDTSELEAEFNADIEDTLEKRRISFTTFPDMGKDEVALQEPLTSGIPGGPEEEDDISGMTIEKGGSLEIGSLDEEDETELAVEERAEPELLEVDVGEPIGEPEPLGEESLYVPTDETEDETPSEPESFHDFFTAYLTPTGSDISQVSAGFDADVPPEVKLSLDALTKRIERLEGALSSISGQPAEAPATACVSMAVVLAGLTQEGFRAVMDDTPMSGERFTVEIERPWKPPLFLKATAVAESSLRVNDITLVRFRFEGLDDAGRMAVLGYLDGRAGYFKSLTDIVKD